MTKNESKLVRVGDLLTGASQLKLGGSKQVVEIVETSADPRDRLPLFLLDGERFLITYSLLDRPA